MPRPQLCGRLRYRGGSRGPRLSLLHLKLTDPALRALRACQRLQGSAQPVLAFQGSQGYIKIPDSPGAGARLFTFYLSRYSKDKPQASFDCVRQYVSRLGRKQLDCVGSIQEKITVCATDGSYQLPREHVPQAEKEAWSRAASEVKPAALGHGQRVATPEELGGEGSAGGRNRCAQGPERRALAQCLVQLLALRPHCKHQLLERLARAQGSRLARAQLLPVLEEVGQLGPRQGSYWLKEELFGQVQEDWLGYTAEEHQHIRQLLRRRRAGRAAARPRLVPLECPSCRRASRRPLSVQRLAVLGAVDPRGLKQPCPPESLPGSLLSSKEEPSEGEGGDEWEEAALRLEQHLSTLPDSSSLTGPPASLVEVPDYCRTYRAICSVAQQRAYAEAFSADYAEYRRLHAQVGHVSRTFIHLGAKIKGLPPGTPERKGVEERILQEYQRFKQTYPSYRKEKDRCEYLHQKLSHIKGLILEFEKRGAVGL